MPSENAVVFKRKLSDAFIRTLTEPGKHADGEVPGLYLEVRPSSKAGKNPSKFWRLKYRLHGKENRFSIGAYPDIGLKEARDIARGARRDVANHTAPLKAKTAKIEAQLVNEERTFAYVAEQWLAFKSADLVTKSIAGFRGALKNHILPAIGKQPVSQIKLEHITAIITELRRQRTMAMARRVRTLIRAVLGFAEGRGWVERNVALSNIEELKIRHIVTSNPAIERPADLGRLLLRLDDCNDGSVATAMRLLVMLPVRPGELAQMRWEDVDLIGADWRYVVSKTQHLDKSKHIVPLPEQALVLLRELSRTRVVDEEGKGWVFGSPIYPGRPINPTSMLKSFQHIWPEYAITAHGFRATYRTIAHEHLGIDPIVLELSLSHRMPGALGAVYARAQLLAQRREAAQQWANYLDLLRRSATHDKES
ncbi:integrase arm-type DNA-binding domain-containing protein [Pseudomonas sp. P115]|uniref:tyrosine-type recombinase/integrase n=1 Tax=Pseudomonas pisciculturae TaxID=2730413 RepID=UPI0018923FC3|nr:integrase arm-type DNA-binding domain-containing protein [Pseudomonas pisciculturae]MBF6029836.1 integrase arm-type DNA-binding domain-containing protein [Pseudomonas pisciculturae]